MRAIQLAAISHRPYGEQRHTLADGRICIRLRTAFGDFDEVTLYHADKYKPGPPWERAQAAPMRRMWRDGVHDMWQAIYMPDDPRQVYWFALEADGETLLHDANGTQPMPEGMEGAVGYRFAHAYPTPKRPAWARGRIGYQIFPDRYSKRGIRVTDDVLEPWDSPRIDNEYHFGGNLAGIEQEVLYIKEVGAEFVYLTPIFDSDTAHRYNTFDYEKIDLLVGATSDLRYLAQELHKWGMRLILDGVFNHCGVEFEPFRDAKEKGKASPYYDWFFFDEKYPCGYMTFSDNYAAMPKLNLQNPQCADYFVSIGRKWIRECNIDGWRLDVSPEVHPDFWRRFRREILEEKPDAVLIAECWDDPREWCLSGDMFDATMHYLLSYPIWDFFAYGAITLQQFDYAVNHIMMMYPQAVTNMMWTMLSSHDTMRMTTRCGSTDRMRGAVFFQMTCAGSPIVYYGDELAMRGGDDPECRACMAWDRVATSRMLTFYEQMARVRRCSWAVREAEMTTYEVGEDGLYAYLRGEGRYAALCALNTTDKLLVRQLRMPAWWAGDRAVFNLVNEKRLIIRNGEVTLKLRPWSGVVLITD